MSPERNESCYTWETAEMPLRLAGPSREIMTRFKNGVFVISGILCVALAVLGMFLPVLPTTPFLLLAAFLFSRSSEKFYERLLNNRFCGEYLRNYREGRGIALKQKVITIAILWATIIYGIWFVGSVVWISLILLAVASGVTIFLISVKTYKPENDMPLMIAERESFEEA